MSDAPVAAAMRRRRSQSSVDDEAPKRGELLELIEVAGGVADHSSLRPWRVIAIRGAARLALGRALAEGAGLEGDAIEKGSTKPLRAPLLLAVVVSPKPSHKVPYWEQESVASGVAHALSLLLDEAGWGVMWRTGLQTRTEPVRRMHGLRDGEELLGWLYVGGRSRTKRGHRKSFDASRHFSTLK